MIKMNNQHPLLNSRRGAGSPSIKIQALHRETAVLNTLVSQLKADLADSRLRLKEQNDQIRSLRSDLSAEVHAHLVTMGERPQCPKCNRLLSKTSAHHFQCPECKITGNKSNYQCVSIG
jgi:predicted RNA-binding Zn-ribbon protein involved in translation (DUF1610 family)